MNLRGLARTDAVLRHLQGVSHGRSQVTMYSQAARSRLGVNQPVRMFDRSELGKHDMEINDIVEHHHNLFPSCHQMALLRAAPLPY